MQPFHPGYAVTVALRNGADLDVKQIDFTDEQETAARAMFNVLCAFPSALAVTLEGPGDIVLAEWEA